MDDTNYLPRDHVPTSSRPLLGMTILVVEDSRYASEAMRLMCVRSGARIRRADCLASARRHLQVYRPTAMIVDLGLPDGSGLELIRDMSNATPRVDVLLATSGDLGLEQAALEVGADGFLPKPVTKLAAFQNLVLSFVDPERRPMGPRLVDPTDIQPDSLAYRDDMVAMAEVLQKSKDVGTVAYVTQFLHGVALSANDDVLLNAVDELRAGTEAGQMLPGSISRVSDLLRDRVVQRASL
ncbi:response regulator [Pseudooceanicola sp. MF1-13]|uniref:response regulator n=1 Tax=Pseudooceanicola sp. MF1-13 TaxID=3379095 RepID=UPI00389152CF